MRNQRLAELHERMLKDTQTYLNRHLRRLSAGHWPVERLGLDARQSAAGGRPNVPGRPQAPTAGATGERRLPRGDFDRQSPVARRWILA